MVERPGEVCGCPLGLQERLGRRADALLPLVIGARSMRRRQGGEERPGVIPQPGDHLQDVFAFRGKPFNVASKVLETVVAD